MPLIPLQAGPLSLVFQPEDGAVRYLHAGGAEVLRGIGAPVRDHTWTTVRPEITDLVIDRCDDGFRVTFTARCCTPAINFAWRGTIDGAADGTITFSFDGEAGGEFRRNRIGFCVLHPAEVAGTGCRIEHTDGRITTGRFPTEISPHQPFFDIRAITHSIAPGLEVEVRMEGDGFEMEDQRNWTDASYKTYCTPLAQPFPVTVPVGMRISQAVTVRLHGASPRPSVNFVPPWIAPAEVRLAIGGPLGLKLPPFGSIWNTTAPTAPAIAAMQALGLRHLRVDLWLAQPEHVTALRTAAQVAGAIDVALEPAIFMGGDAAAQLSALRESLSALPIAPRIARWLVFHDTKFCTPADCIRAVQGAFSGTKFAAPVGGGATDNFTELNRDPAPATVGDFAVYACNPQVHASDPDSVRETIAMQGVVAANASRLARGRPVVVSPLTLTPRWQRESAAAPKPRPTGGSAFQADGRQASAFGAAWLIGCLVQLATAGVASITFCEMFGPSGLLSETGQDDPSANALRLLAPLTDAELVAVSSHHPNRVAALAFHQVGRSYLLIVNLGAEPQLVSFQGAGFEGRITAAPHEVRLLDLRV